MADVSIEAVELRSWLERFQAAQSETPCASVWLYVRRLSDRTPAIEEFLPPYLPDGKPRPIGHIVVGNALFKANGLKAHFQIIHLWASSDNEAAERFWKLSQDVGRALELEPRGKPGLAWSLAIHRALSDTYYATEGFEGWRYDPFDSSIACLEQMLERIKPEHRSRSTPPIDGTPATTRLAKPSKVAKAIAILSENPEWSNKRIAEAVPCNVKYLSQAPKFKAARRAIRDAGRRELPRGSKGADGSMEAYDDF